MTVCKEEGKWRRGLDIKTQLAHSALEHNILDPPGRKGRDKLHILLYMCIYINGSLWHIMPLNCVCIYFSLNSCFRLLEIEYIELGRVWYDGEWNWTKGHTLSSGWNKEATSQWPHVRGGLATEKPLTSTETTSQSNATHPHTPTHSFIPTCILHTHTLLSLLSLRYIQLTYIRQYLNEIFGQVLQT